MKNKFNIVLYKDDRSIIKDGIDNYYNNFNGLTYKQRKIKWVNFGIRLRIYESK